MSKRPAAFFRPGFRRVKNLFLVSTEGSVTEREYFDLLCRMNPEASVKYSPGSHHSSPVACLEEMGKLLKNGLGQGDEAWLVIDVDSWKISDISLLLAWEAKHPSHHVAISNPCFEVFLLLHFQDTSSPSKEHCSKALKKHIPGYNKHISSSIFTRDRIQQAILRAQRQKPQNIPQPGQTTVYELASRLLGE